MSSADPCVAALATATPQFEVPQSDARAFARGFFAADFPHIDRLLTAFDNTGIAKRHMARPIGWYAEPHRFVEKNAVYVETALELSQSAATAALERSGVDPSEIGSVVLVSSTGVATPSLDSTLVPKLGLSPAVRRVPIWGLGCAGGAAGLARTAELVRGTGKPALLIAVEVCSTTFVHGDRSKSNLIATALFGDGAAAAVVVPETRAGCPQVVGSHSRLLEDSADVMGWIVHDEGLQVRFAKSIPQIVRDVVPQFLTDLIAAQGLQRSDVEQFVLHPGGAKVLEAYARALEVEPEALAHSHAVISEFGNMSSPTVLFVLDRFMRAGVPSGSWGTAIGLGPGFSAEGVLLRWSES